MAGKGGNSNKITTLTHTSPFGDILSCNVHALKYTQINHFKKAFENFNIVSLQETHGRKNFFAKTINKLGFKNGVFSLLDKQIRGSAVLWKEGKLIASTTDNQGRIAGAALEINAQTIIVISVYAPNLDGTHKSWEEYTAFLVTLEMHIDKLCSRANTDKIIVNGDFNLILNSELDSYSQHPKVYDIPKQALMDMTDRLGLSDAFRVLNGDLQSYTFAPGAQNVNKIYNRLDYAWVTSGMLDMTHDCTHLTVGN